MSIQEESKSLTADILKVFFELGYDEVDNSGFIQEILGEETNEIIELAKEFNERIHSIANYEVKDIATPIVMEVVSVNDDFTVNLIKPQNTTIPDSLKDQPWTNIKNPTIFKYLEKGDKVLVGHNEGSVSSCWVMFAMINGDDFNKKTIYRDINKMYEINDNTLILKKWLEKMAPEAFPPNVKTDSEGNTIYEENPLYTQFKDEMRKWKKVDKT